MTPEYIDIVFDGPPGHVAGRFVEVESPPGTSISFGEWVHRDDGFWALRFKSPAALVALDLARVEEAGDSLRDHMDKCVKEATDRTALVLEKRAEARIREIALAVVNEVGAELIEKRLAEVNDFNSVDKRISVLESRLDKQHLRLNHIEDQQDAPLGVGEKGGTEKAGVWCETCKAWYPADSAHAMEVGHPPAPRAVAEEGYPTADGCAADFFDGTGGMVSFSRSGLVATLERFGRSIQSAAAERGRMEMAADVRSVLATAAKPQHICSSCGLSDEEEAERRGGNVRAEKILEALEALLTPNPAGVPEG